MRLRLRDLIGTDKQASFLDCVKLTSDADIVPWNDISDGDDCDDPGDDPGWDGCREGQGYDDCTGCRG